MQIRRQLWRRRSAAAGENVLHNRAPPFPACPENWAALRNSWNSGTRSSAHRATRAPATTGTAGARGRRKAGSTSPRSPSAGKGATPPASGGAELPSPQHRRAPALRLHHGTVSPVPPASASAAGQRLPGRLGAPGVAAELQPDARPPPAAAQRRSPLVPRRVTGFGGAGAALGAAALTFTGCFFERAGGGRPGRTAVP